MSRVSRSPLPQRRRFAWAAAAMALVGGVTPASDATAAVPPASAPARLYIFSFADADVAVVVNEILGETLHLPFAIDPAVTGKITLRIERRLTGEQLLGVLEAALSANDIAMVRIGGQISLVPKAKARGASGVQPASRSQGGRSGYQLVAEPLQYGTPSEVAKVLAAIGPAGVVVHADDRLGLLVLGGTSAELRAAHETLALFDRSGLAEARLRFLTLKGASAASVTADLERLLTAANISGIAVVPIRQLNAIVILGRSQAALDEAETWARRFDRPSTEEATTLWTYRPRNLSADSLADALRSLSSGNGGGASSSTAKTSDTGALPSPQLAPTPPEVGGEGEARAFDPEALRVSVEKSTNTLLVMAPSSRWQSLHAALEQLDQAPDQVLIEATVLEVTLNDDFRFGVDWSFLSGNGKLGATLSELDTGEVQPTYPGVSLTYLNGGVRAVVDALASKTNVEVMSAPKLLALDNHSASLQVGDQVPVVTQRAQGTAAPGAPLVVTTEYRDTGVILRIKPRINGDKTVLLDFSQEVSGVSKTTSSDIDSPTIQQRKFESSLEVREGQTIALGGLISSQRSWDDGGVPWLKDIPVAGALFKTANRGRKRTELIVLLSAKILRSTDTVLAGSEDLKASMEEIARRGLFDRH